jgi:hypothetical protein
LPATTPRTLTGAHGAPDLHMFRALTRKYYAPGTCTWTGIRQPVEPEIVTSDANSLREDPRNDHAGEWEGNRVFTPACTFPTPANNRYNVAMEPATLAAITASREHQNVTFY